ncbi:MAG: TIGR01440 family protein [Oscillospiraceae bacterium]|nr:TIGR01440 family protein [Oscillospiraceae bacterium]
MAVLYDEIELSARKVAEELIISPYLAPGDVVVVGCSSGEICGRGMGRGPDAEAASAVFRGIMPVFGKHGLFLAAQCCEHLNRALVIELEAAVKHGCEIVSARPYPDAGGAFAAAAYDGMSRPVLVESIRAAGGIDIGGTLIGMHIRNVAVPLALSVREIGCAHVTAAYSRPKLIGGARTKYE